MVADTGLGSSIIPQNCMPVVQMVSKLWSINLQFKMVTGCILDFNFHHVLHPYRFSDLYLPSCLFWSLQHSHLRFWVFIVLAQMYDLQDLESRFKVIHQSCLGLTGYGTYMSPMQATGLSPTVSLQRKDYHSFGSEWLSGSCFRSKSQSSRWIWTCRGFCMSSIPTMGLSITSMSQCMHTMGDRQTDLWA
jgi:hypothetical protein